MTNKKNKQVEEIEYTKEFASTLEAICARLSGSFYDETNEHIAPALMYIHGIGWSIENDLETLKSSLRRQEN